MADIFTQFHLHKNDSYDPVYALTTELSGQTMRCA